jgi:hypothetical protein
MASDKDDDVSFFSTPMGWFAIMLMVGIVLAVIGLLVSKFSKNNGGNRMNGNSLKNNNWYRNRGQVPPSLAGYI